MSHVFTCLKLFAVTILVLGACSDVASAQSHNPAFQVMPTMKENSTDPTAIRDACLNPSQWPTGWNRMDFFGGAIQYLEQMTNAQLTQCAANVHNAGKKLVIQLGALKDWCPSSSQCWSAVLPILQRFRSVGFTFDYLELDEPLSAGVGSYSYAVQETGNFINLARTQYPGQKITLVEAYPLQQALIINFFRDVNNAAKSLTGTGIQYAMIDHNWKAGGSLTGVSQIQNSVRSNGMKFGVIYWNADPGLSWYDGLMKQGLTYRNARAPLGVAPDLMAVENWTGTPTTTLPESNLSHPFVNSVRDFANAFAPYPTSSYGLQANQQLTSGQSRNSVDGRFKLIYQTDGNLVLYKGTTPLWNSQTFGHSTGKTIQQSDGNLVVYDAGNIPVWASNTSGKNGAFLVVQSDGNLVIYYNYLPVWASNTNFY